MPKIKTHRGAAKRFKLTKSGKIKMAHSFKNHKLGKKPPKRKRGLRKSAIMSEANAKVIKKILPYM